MEPFKNRIFRVIWLAVLVSSIGTWMRDVASGWMMTELSTSPLLVSLVQAATTLPIFLFSLSAGALADIVDRRMLLIAVQLVLLTISLALTVVAYLGLMTPAALLALIFAGGIGGAFAGPAFQAIIPEIVGKAQLRPAVALNSLGINMARAIGPALGGLIIAGAGVAAAFLTNTLSYLLIIAAFIWWPRGRTAPDLPPEAFGSAMRAGIRYATQSPIFRHLLMRAAGFFLFGSAYWALLPVIARSQLRADPQFYGVLLGSIGSGAVVGALLMPRLKFASGRLVFGGTLITAFVMVGLATTENKLLAVLLLLVAGTAWISVLTTLYVAAQSVVPDWVRARGLAVYLMVQFGAMTAGSALWGSIAEAWSIPVALLAAAALSVIAGTVLAVRVPMPRGDADLSPSLSWPEPATSGLVANDRGPVLITIAYDISPPDRRAFLDALHLLAAIRRRDGAFGWRVFEDAEDPARLEEIFFATSWLEHLRQHRRLTVADALLQRKVQAFHRGGAPPLVRHLLAARPDDAGSPAQLGDHRH
jgi:MFS family permease